MPSVTQPPAGSLTIPEAVAAGWGSSPGLRYHIRKGALPAVRVGKQYFVCEDDLAALRRHVDQPDTPYSDLEAATADLRNAWACLTPARRASVASMLRSAREAAAKSAAPEAAMKA